MENKLAGACGRVDVLLEAFKTDALRFQSYDGVDQMPERSPQPIQAPDHQSVATSQVADGSSKTRTLGFRPRNVIGEELLAACLFETVQLKVESLIVRGDAGVADQHRSSLEDGQLPALLLFPPLFGFGWNFLGRNSHPDSYRIKTHRRSQVLLS